jgi:hypothetical protein
MTTTTKTVADKLAEYDAKIEAAVSRLERERDVLRALPADMECPVVSNERGDAGELAAWLAWRSYRKFNYSDAATRSGADILAALEGAGWVPLPATLCQYGSWRRSPRPGAADDMPATNGRDELRDTEPIAPVWLAPNPHTDTEAIAFYRAPDGRLFRVCVEGPAGVYIHARRVEYRGDWHYEGPARIVFPDWWHAAIADHANIGAHTRGYVDTPQGLSGVVYFQPHGEQTEFPSPATFLRMLEAKL